jgi:FtsP/CotA-like multicopper oxidase with cupredoxin domain
MTFDCHETLRESFGTLTAAKKASMSNHPLGLRRPYLGAPATVVLAVVAGCMNHMDDMGNMGGAPDVIELPPAEGQFETEAAPDLDPADDVVEVELEAKASEVEVAPGRRVRMWTYNGSLPGPLIEANVGDLVRVRFRNSLPEETTIHWHGLRVPSEMDGVPRVQSTIAPGDEFTYEFVVPDAGTFWYHPHVRSDEQVERGLYGSIVVRGLSEPETTSDRVVVLDDVLINPSTWQLAGFDQMMQGMVGRQGNVLLANGRAHPIVEVRPGGLHRFRFINAANARYFRLALPGRSFNLIGTDGGPLETPRKLREILLVPGQRADVVVVADDAADSALEWQTLPYDRGHGTGALPQAAVFQMRSTAEDAVTTPVVPSELGSIGPLSAPSKRRKLELEESMGGHSGPGGGAVFSINGFVYPDTEVLNGTLGTVEEWSIVNTTPMDHPFHLHGFRFQLASDDGVAPDFLAWRDTINVRAQTTTRFHVELEDHAGTWMFHCHILEHAERGMMGELQVSE